MSGGVAIRTSTVIRPQPDVRWMAVEASGLGHGFRRGEARSVCAGVKAVDERFAWPVAERCEACLVVTEPPGATAQIWGR